MSPNGEALLAHARTLFACLDEHEKRETDEVDAIVCGIVMHLRSRYPERAATLFVLGEPEEREPRPSNVRPADALRIFNERKATP